MFVAPLFMREEFSGIMVASTPDEMPRSTADRSRPCRRRWPWPLESAALTEDLLLPAERGALRLAGAELLGHRDRDRARHDDPLREPVGDARARRTSPSELEGTKFADLIHPDDKTRVLAFLTSLGEDEATPGSIEFRLRHHDGPLALRGDPAHQPAARPRT